MPARPPSRSLRGAAAVVLVTLALLTPLLAGGGALGAPPPQSVCGPCHEGLEAAALDHRVPLRVTSSTGNVVVHPNGSATWSVTTRFEREDSPDGVRPNATLRSLDALRENATLGRAVARAAVRDSRDYLEPDRPDATLQSVTWRNGSVQFTYREPDVARRTPGGVLVLDEFHTRGRGSGWFVDVDTLEIVGPEGTVVASEARGAMGSDVAAIDGRRVVLDGDPANPPRLHQRDVYVAFARPGPAAGVLATVGIAVATSPIVIETLTTLHLPGFLLLVAALAAIHRVRGRRGEREPLQGRPLLGWVVWAVGAYLAVSFAAFPPALPHPMLTGVLSGLLAIYAALLAVLSWLVYPRIEDWV